MSDIQQLAKPIVVPLIEGIPTSLDRQQQKTLAAWISMAVMCSEFGRDDSRTISQGERDVLFNHHVPPKGNWRIWIGDYERDKWESYWARHVLTITKEKTRKSALLVRPPLNTQSTTYMVGRLYIHCISSAVPAAIRGFHFSVPDRPFLRRIWPIESASFSWPPPTMKDRDALRISSAFFDWMREIGERSIR